MNDPDETKREGLKSGGLIKPWISTGFFLSIVLSILLSAVLLFRLSGFDQARIDAVQAEARLLELNSQTADARATNVLLSTEAIQLTEQKALLEASVQKISDERDALIAARQDLSTTMGRLDSAKTELNKLSDTIKASRAAKKTFESDLQKLELNIREAQLRHDDLSVKNTNIVNLLTKRQSLQNELDIITNRLSVETENLVTFRASLSRNRDEHDTLTREIGELRRNISIATDRSDELKQILSTEEGRVKDLDDLGGRISEAKNKLEGLTLLLSREQVNFDSVKTGIAKKTTEFTTLSNSVEQIKMDKAKTASDALTEKLKLADLKSDIEDERAELAGIKLDIEKLRTEETDLKRKKRTVEGDLRQLNAQIRIAEKKNTGLTENISEARADLSEVEDQLAESRDKLLKIRETRRAIEININELQRMEDDLKKKIDKL